jgi:hypothetical protein
VLETNHVDIWRVDKDGLMYARKGAEYKTTLIEWCSKQEQAISIGIH